LYATKAAYLPTYYGDWPRDSPHRHQARKNTWPHDATNPASQECFDSGLRHTVLDPWRPQPPQAKTATPLPLQREMDGASHDRLTGVPCGLKATYVARTTLIFSTTNCCGVGTSAPEPWRGIAPRNQLWKSRMCLSTFPRQMCLLCYPADTCGYWPSALLRSRTP
jgi:hypothetical protein